MVPKNQIIWRIRSLLREGRIEEAKKACREYAEGCEDEPYLSRVLKVLGENIGQEKTDIEESESLLSLLLGNASAETCMRGGLWFAVCDASIR